MVNYYDRKRFISKSTLARLADVIIRSWKEEIHREVDADNWRSCARQPGKLSTTTKAVDNDNKGR